MVYCILKALVIELQEGFSVRINEPYAGKVGEVEIWELLFLIVKNWPIPTFTECYAILQVFWADMVVDRMVLWSIYTKLLLQKIDAVAFKLESRPMSGYMRDCFLKPVKECLSVAEISLVHASHFPCHFFLRLLSG